MKIEFSYLLIVFLSCSGPLSSQTTFPSKSALDSTLDYLSERGLFNGVVLVAREGKIVYQKALGNEQAGSVKPLSIRSSFNLASVSKQFMAMMVMMLEEKGKLKYDDPLQTYLPHFPYPNITIRHLLTHTSGLPEYDELFRQYLTTLDTLNNQRMMDLLIQVHPPLHFSPGSQWEYSNTAYVLLGTLISTLTQQPIETYFQQQIAGPLGMKDTYIYYLNMHIPQPKASSRVYGMDRQRGSWEPYDLIREDGVIGDGNIYSSATDLLKWDQALYTERLVKRTTMEAAFEPVLLSNGKNHPYGFGWFVPEKGKTVSHTGSWVGFRTLIERHLNDHSTLIVLTNGNSGIAIPIIRDLIKGVQPQLPRTQLITNVSVIDGTGLPAVATAVRIKDNKIYETGPLQPAPGEPVIDGEGKTLVPGFIDTHSHHLEDLLKNPDGLAAVNQGITTIIIGQDGFSTPFDTLEQLLSQKAIAVNIGSYTGQASLRQQVMGKANVFRTATPKEVEQMKLLLQHELEKGSLGLSTGLEYEPAFYSNRDEVIELAKVAAAAQARYMSHIRSEDINQQEALEEIIQIGKKAQIPVQISHIKIALKEHWNTSEGLLAQLQMARQEGVNITADVYPYTYWNSTLRVLFPQKDFSSLASAEMATRSLFDPSQSYLVEYDAVPGYKNKTVTQVAAERKETPAQTLVKLVQLAEEYEARHPEQQKGSEAIAATSMSETDIENFLRWSNTNVCSDGNAGGHPRGYGAFTRVLGRYVRERKIITLENAIYKMTGLAAEHLGLHDRGLIRPGQFADLVLLDPETVQDNATIGNSHALSSGIEKVWVNGRMVYQHQQATGQYPGQLIKRPLSSNHE
jgi:N-acyl-D-aspartate/D-glutamate deacylase/CubicO group peptidase (beta-lactamase class C family)